jgi:hypothetical protein
MKKDEKKGVYLTQVTGMPDVCFLTFHRPVTIYSGEIVDWHAGAYLDPGRKKWFRIDEKFVKANEAKFSHTLLWDFEPPKTAKDTPPPRIAYLDLFSETIYTNLKGFSHEKRGEYLKGRTFGSAIENCPGIIMKVLKTGFDALGIVHSAYDGWRTAAFTVDDIRIYMERMLAYGRKLLDGNLYRGVEAVSSVGVSLPKDPAGYLHAWKLPAERSSRDRQLYGQHIQGTVLGNYKPTPGAVGTFKGGEDPAFRSPLINPATGYVVVSEYGFRGDSRPPVDIRALGGMQPNAIRDDRQTMRGVKEVLDSFDHQASWGSDYSGYVSWSRNIGTAYKFMRMATKGNSDGWIYAARCRDAVDVKATFVKPRYEEYEISVPGGTEWSEIVAWRKVCKQGTGYAWDSKVYLTTDQGVLPKTKRAEILKLFSWPLKAVATGA